MSSSSNSYSNSYSNSSGSSNSEQSPTTKLERSKYRDLKSINMFYDDKGEELRQASLSDNMSADEITAMKRLLRPEREDIRVLAKNFYDQLVPEYLANSVNRADIAVLLAKRENDKIYKRDRSYNKRLQECEAKGVEMPVRLKYEDLSDELKKEVYRKYKVIGKARTVSNETGLSVYMVKKIIKEQTSILKSSN